MALAVVLWLVLTAVLVRSGHIGLNLITGIHVVHGVLLLGFCHWAVTRVHDDDRSDAEKSPPHDNRE